MGLSVVCWACTRRGDDYCEVCGTVTCGVCCCRCDEDNMTDVWAFGMGGDDVAWYRDAPFLVVLAVALGIVAFGVWLIATAGSAGAYAGQGFMP